MSSADAAFQKATEFHRAGDSSAAEAHYRQALKNAPDLAEAAAQLALLLSQQGRHDQALQYYVSALAARPDDAETHANMADTLVALGRIDEAEKHLRLAVAADSNQALAWAKLGDIHYHRGELDGAAGCYRTALAAQADQPDILNNLGSTLSRLGRLDEAAETYRRALAVAPQRTDIHRNMANVCFMQGQAPLAEPHLRAVIGGEPDNAQGFSDLGLCLKHQGRLKEAEAALLTAIDIDPFIDSAWQRLAEMRLDNGDPDGCREALEQADLIDPDSLLTLLGWGHYHAARDQQAEAAAYYARVCELQPDNPSFFNCLGNALHFSRQFEPAVAAFERAIALQPEFSEANNNLANVYVSMNQRETAVVHYRRSLEIMPEQAVVACNLGNVFRDLGRITEAIAAFHCAIEIDPKLHNAYNGLGLAQQVQNRHEASIEAFRAALEINPDYAEALNNLAISLTGVGRYHEAVDTYKRLLEVKPDLPEALFNLGTLLQTLSRWDQSVIVFMKAIDCRPDYNIVYPYLAHSLMQQCSWTNLDGIIEQIRTNTETELADGLTASVSAFALQSLPGEFSMDLRQRVAEQICRRVTSTVTELRAGLSFSFPKVRRRAKLRIGYVSPDFRFHSVAVAFKGILDNHDRERFELYGYSLHSGPDDGMTEELKRGFNSFTKVADLSYRDAAQKIAGDEIDILIDLAGHTRGSWLEMLALRPAPIQAHYLGYSATIGADFLDYLISDHQQVPEEQRQYFTEQLVYLPDTFMATQRAPIAIDIPDRAHCGLPEGAFVFCNFNANYKIEPRMFSIWMRLLRRVPNSVLWLIAASPTSIANLRREAQARGVDPERLVFAERVPHPVHLARLSHADLALDNFYHGGGVTTVDCLWTGVPLLSLTGPTPQSRNGASLLSAIGMDELIAHSLPDYEKLAFTLANDPERLQSLHDELLARRNSYPLFRPERLTRHLERGYELMWERYEAGEPPGVIDVPRLAEDA